MEDCICIYLIRREYWEYIKNNLQLNNKNTNTNLKSARDLHITKSYSAIKKEWNIANNILQLANIQHIISFWFLLLHISLFTHSIFYFLVGEFLKERFLKVELLSQKLCTLRCWQCISKLTLKPCWINLSIREWRGAMDRAKFHGIWKTLDQERIWTRHKERF